MLCCRPVCSCKKTLQRIVCAASFAVLLALPAGTMAQTAVSIELVLAVDTSLSVNDDEYALQMSGIANAFRNPEIIALIEQQDGVAVTLFQWSSVVDQRFMVPWALLHTPDSALAFAQSIEKMKRDPVRGFTAIGRAIEFGMHLLDTNRFAGQHLKIDVSGDGRNNRGPEPSDTWSAASAKGIVINGLPILVDTFNMDIYFREKVIHGPGAFIEIAKNFHDFSEAFLRKLRRELALMTSEDMPAGKPLQTAGEGGTVSVSSRQSTR